MKFIEKFNFLKNKQVPLHIVGIIVLLAFLPLLIMMSQKSRDLKMNAQEKTQAPINEGIILLSDQGFTPETIKIKQGNSVKWINESSSNFASVNSDDYPTNKLYPEINLGQFKKHISLVHMFMHPGVYTYHNQYNPKQKGTITVQ